MYPDSEDSSQDPGDSTTLPGWARPAVPRPELDFECGEVINSRFEVLEMIGAGGMGQVYRVRDKRSGSTRALKTLKGELVFDAEVRSRFERELVDAQQITHPNVCRVYDIDSIRHGSAERPFYTMELLAGETLAQRLQREYPLKRREALQIIRGIAAGLDAAHATGSGIVHRDLKPANIMLVNGPEGTRPIILDFGIAKRLGRGDETSSDLRPGTPAYMAPEQKQGKPVSAATDVYALALILTEMISQSDAARYYGIIDKALSLDAEKRHQSAGALARALRRADVTRRGWMIGLGVTIPTACAALLQWHDGMPGGAPLIVMAPVESALGATRATLIEPKAVYRLLAHQIGQSSSIDLVSDERLATRVKELNGGRSDVKADAAMLRRVAVAEGAPYVLFSELGELGGRRELRLKLERNGRVIDNETFPFAETNDLPAVATDAADWLRGKLQRPGVKARDAGLPELTTDKWDALQAYVRGDEAWKEHRQEDAAREFEEALRIDPEFAGAEARLGDILTAAWRVDDGLAHWSRAAALARGKALAGREMLRIRGVFALDTGDVAEAERALALFVASYPEEPLAHYYYSSVAMRLKRPAQALEMMETAVRLNPGNYAFQVGLADVRMFRGELEEAKAALRKALPMRPEDGTARRGLAAVEFAESHYDECRKHLESILEQANESSQSLAYSALACLEAEMGRSGEILKWLDKGMDLDRRLNALSALGQKMRLKAEYYLAAGDKRAAVSACDEIRGLGLGAQAEMEAGCLLARAGDVSKAAICRVKELADWPIYLHWERRLEGEMALARGDARAALRLMAGAPPREDNAYWPEFLFRAAMAAGDKARAKGMRQELESTLAYRWFDPERTALGFVRMARSIA